MNTPSLIDGCAMKYNVGDTVYAVGKLQFLDNPYHFESALNAFYTVKVADERRFSVGNRELTDVCGMDMWEVNYQADGRPMYSDRVLLHVAKDREAIVAAIDRVVDAFLQKAERQKKEKIAANKAKIKALRAEIADIEQNGVTFGFKNVRMLPFIMDNKKKLVESLGQ